MGKPRRYGTSTRSIHTDIRYLKPDAHAMPVFDTTAYTYKSLADADKPEYSFKYARIATPNGEVLEKTLCSLEEGEAALVVADGMRAISLAISSMITPGIPGTILCTTPVYSDTYGYLTKDLPAYGKNSLFLSAHDPIEQLRCFIRRMENHLTSPIEILFIESPANPTLSVYDIANLSRVAHDHGILVLVDNTLASPYNQRPLTLGADICIESLTKYCGGHGIAMGGAVIGAEPLISRIREKGKREGGHLSPDEASRLQHGLQTFEERMKKHNDNAMRFAKFLASDKWKSKILKINYPGLRSHPEHDRAAAQMRTPSGKPGFGGMVSFILRNPEWVQPFADCLAKSFIELCVSFGSTGSTFIIPARYIHGGIRPQERQALGISDALIRFSVGIEKFEDIRYEVSKALSILK